MTAKVGSRNGAPRWPRGPVGSCTRRVRRCTRPILGGVYPHSQGWRRMTRCIWTCRCGACAVPMQRGGWMPCWKTRPNGLGKSRRVGRYLSFSPAILQRCAPSCAIRHADCAVAACWQAPAGGDCALMGSGPNCRTWMRQRWRTGSWTAGRTCAHPTRSKWWRPNFSCQGLELDQVGLCWGGDLVRGLRAGGLGGAGFCRDEVAAPRAGREAIANRINTYRVLLTRARIYETVIWVPRGDAADGTRKPAELDALAAYLSGCGVRQVAGKRRPCGVAAPGLPLLV